MSLLKANALTKTFINSNERVTALDDVNLQIDRGEIVMIFGPSGSGKSTLLNVLGGLDTPDKGEIFFEDKRFDNLSDKTRSRMRLFALSIIFQSFELIQVMRCFDNIAYPLRMQGLPKNEIKERIRHFAKALDIEPLLKRKPDQISAGQRQRVAIARALVTMPKLILGDEITANIDHELKHKIIMYLMDYVHKNSTSFILVTHDIGLSSYADRSFKMTDGRLIASPSFK